jgi:hypothetical protein
VPALSRRQQIFARWAGVPVLVGVVIAALLYFTGQREDPTAAAEDGTVEGITSVLSREVTASAIALEEVREAAGIEFTHFPATRRSLLPEDMGSGLAWGDYDNDGDEDLFLVNFAASILDDPADGGASALYRNEGEGRFRDMAGIAGLDTPGFYLGAVWGDYDNDDDLDLYISGYGPNHLYRNEGDGSFSDVTETAGIGDDRFSAGSAWSDYDGDGFIDLYVTNYVRFDEGDAGRRETVRQYGSEIPYTINPSAYPAEANALFHNNGDGTFTDVAEEAGVANPRGRSLSAAWFDFDDDGFVDLYVANDVSENGVFRNLGNGAFADIGPNSLAADYRGAMGLAVGDPDRDGDTDLFVTHWIAQENAFFENMYSENYVDDAGNRRLFFMDTADMVGLGQISLHNVGWATGLTDLDNDGYLDAWVVNGNTLEFPDDHSRLKPQQMQIFRHKPGEGFFEIGQQAATVLAEPIVGRGGAHADYDGDGRVDIAVMTHGGSPLLLRNVSDTDNHWLVVRLRQRGGNTRALGARVQVRTGDGVQTSQVGVTGSYLSQNSLDLHFGLGEADVVDEIVIRWPDGTTESHENIPSGSIVTWTHAPL